MIIIKRPIITEKSMRLAQNGWYTFEVDKNATKHQVAKKVAKKFNVKVIKVQVINVKGKIKQQKRARKSYKVVGFKKAMVQVSKGQTIGIFEAPKKEAIPTGVGTEGEPIKLKEKRDILGRTKIKVEKTAVGAAPTTQRKVITGK